MIRTTPDPARASQVRAFEDFGLLPVLFGATLSSVVDRKAVNALYTRYLSTDQTMIVYVPNLPTGASVELPACESLHFLTLAQSCQVSIWPAGYARLSRAVPGLAAIQQRLAPATPGSEPAALIAKAKSIATSDPGEALRLLKQVSKLPTTDAALQAECKSVHDPIVRSLKDRQRDINRDIKEASAEKQRLGTRVAEEPKNNALRNQYEAATSRLDRLNEDAARVRALLELR